MGKYKFVVMPLPMRKSLHITYFSPYLFLNKIVIILYIYLHILTWPFIMSIFSFSSHLKSLHVVEQYSVEIMYFI